MKLVYTAQSMPMVAHVKNVLEGRGIACEIRNQYLAGAAGELPPIQCWPELWVQDFCEDYARELVSALLAENTGDSGRQWRCPGCGEWVDGNFAACWKCETPCPEGE